MLCYLNRGLILEQAVCFLLKDYFDTLHLESAYSNFHIDVSTEHPFAQLLEHEGLNAADTFPAIVVTTQEDRKTQALSEMRPQLSAVGIDGADLEEITRTSEARGGGGAREIPGICTVVDEDTLEAVGGAIEKRGFCYGWSVRTRRTETLGIEIWATNNQLKNELYEQVRLFVTGFMPALLQSRYPFFDIAVMDGSVTGHRSNNYNFQFDVALSGSHISFDANYCVEQILLDTELEEISTEIITEAKNYVKD